VTPNGKQETGQGAGKQAPRDDRIALEGKWQAVAVETDGRVAPPDFVKRIQWRFAKGFLMIKGTVPVGEVPCSVTLDQAARPRAIEYTGLGTKQAVLGIYELRGDRLEVCLITHPRPRPTQFATAPNSRLTRILFAREK
jgi:uncharacterized protein (TIGR03067 family)